MINMRTTAFIASNTLFVIRHRNSNVYVMPHCNIYFEEFLLAYLCRKIKTVLVKKQNVS